MITKKELYTLLKKLYKLAIKKDFKNFNETNSTCTKIMINLFGNKFKKEMKLLNGI